MRLRLKSVDASRPLSKAAKAKEHALWAVAQNALSDCTPYVPYLTGALQRSGDVSVSGSHAYVMWGTDAETARYARAQYYGTGLDHSTDANAKRAPKAQHHWVEAARAVRGDAWEATFRRVYGGDLR